MSVKQLLRSFAGGEITPELAGRIDLGKYQTGLSLCRNFITLPHGPAARRPGFEYIIEARDSTRAVRLMPFSFSATQTAVLEFGHQYIRFHIDGGTLLEAGKAIRSIVGSTVTTHAAHGFLTGDDVFIGGRFCRITVTGATTFTTADRWGNAATPTGGFSSEAALDLNFLTGVYGVEDTGALVARAYTVTTPYVEADLFQLNFAQSADIITITHAGYAARQLARNAATDWTLTVVSLAAPTDVPTGVVATPTVAVSTNLTQAKYVVTAVQADGVTETLASASASATNNLTLAGNFNTITWDGVDGATRYNVYKQRGGTYGYIGQVSPVAGTTKTIATAVRGGVEVYEQSKVVEVTTTGAHGFTTGDRVLIADTGVASFDGYWQITVTSSTEFNYTSAKKSFLTTATTGTASIPSLSLTDDNVLADTAQSPPEDIIALNAEAGDYPAATTYHEQRRWFAGTNDKPQVLWATRTGTEANLTSSIPSREADGMELRVASSQYNQIRHLVALADLIALTAGGEFRIYSEGAPAITPTSVTIKPQGYAGSSTVQPVTTTGSILYVQAQGSRLRELAYSWEANAYRTTDVSIMAPHRFNGFTVTQLAYTRAPDSILWAVRNDGTLLGMTYVPDQQVYGWHAHDTDGTFESISVVAESNEDVLYAVVKRTVNGRSVRYVERLRTRVFVDQADAFFVDSGLTYDGPPVSTLSGLWHLEGKTVNVLADGAVEPPRAVVNGQIAMAETASKIHVGLPITADLRTLPLAMEGAQAAGQGTVKNINRVHMRVSQSSVLKAGPAFTRLREYPARAVADPYGTAPALRDGELSLTVDPSWNQDAAVCVRQDLPLPLTLLSMTLEAQTGG